MDTSYAQRFVAVVRMVRGLVALFALGLMIARSCAHQMHATDSSQASDVETPTVVAVTQPPGWYMLTSEEGGFSALVPVVPHQENTPVDWTLPVTQSVVFAQSTPTFGYMMMYQDFTVSVQSKPDAVFEAHRHVVSMYGLDGTITQNQAIHSGSYPGKEVVIEKTLDDGTKLTVISKMYLRGNRAYTVFAHTKVHPLPEAITTFIDSFQLVTCVEHTCHTL